MTTLHFLVLLTMLLLTWVFGIYVIYRIATQNRNIQNEIDRKAMELFKQYTEKLNKQKLLPYDEEENDNKAK